MKIYALVASFYLLPVVVPMMHTNPYSLILMGGGKYRGKIKKGDKIKLTYTTRTSGGFGGMGSPPPQSLTVRRTK